MIDYETEKEKVTVSSCDRMLLSHHHNSMFVSIRVSFRSAHSSNRCLFLCLFFPFPPTRGHSDGLSICARSNTPPDWPSSTNSETAQRAFPPRTATTCWSSTTSAPATRRRIGWQWLVYSSFSGLRRSGHCETKLGTFPRHDQNAALSMFVQSQS